MLVTAVCVLFQIKLRCLKTKSIEKLVLKKLSITIASRFEVADEEKYRRMKRQEDKWKREGNHKVLEKRYDKVGKWKKLPSKFSRVGGRCPRPNTVAVLYIHKFSYFALYVSINCVFRSCWNWATPAISTTSDNMMWYRSLLSLPTRPHTITYAYRS